ncbi:type II secretion system protein [Desulfobotulus sp.]|uniref:pilus assembly FimT family protein n=1 Tax=Desulfobotulus sp. TaxID=1940337 RepID=UPI002A3707C2|nr:type II secretion system protein [Desulfobotulus sp.]MDY0163062.1 type II secretion system protein [Desulfobotulus sp.]
MENTNIKGVRPLFKKNKKGSDPFCGPFYEGGFTMIEIIAVLVILGILAAVVLPRLQGSGEREVIQQYHEVRSRLRYAQSRAMAAGGGWGVTFSGNAYWMQNPAGTKVPFPGLSEDSVSVAHGFGAEQVVRFSDRGIPVDGSDNALGADQTISMGGKSLTINRITGAIQ